METPTFPAKTLYRLAERVITGDVVFFIGSGFSIDSEGNSARRLMTRLLIRLFAMVDVLKNRGVKKAGDVLVDLTSTFQIELTSPPDGAFPLSDKAITTLADRYYEANEWFCVAYGDLLQLIRRQPRTQWSEILDAVAKREETIRTAGRGDRKPLDLIPLEKIDRSLVDRANGADVRVAGKSLFLDAMGFRNKDVMGGEPAVEGPNKVLESYGTRLLPRHHILARLAREGFCSTTLTANFDLLLEGAFRIAGFTMKLPGNQMSDAFSPPTYYDDFARITSPSEFFSQGKAHRTALLVKMHGCAEKYRHISATRWPELSNYLPSMVFTYREIQNWRQDSWAADYLRTLLRTRTVVFCGYSLQDPVIHDTFRTVYEDMAKQLWRGAESRLRRSNTRQKVDDPKMRRRSDPGKAPAFFMAPGSQERREFHGMEVLQAATRAIGTMATRFNSHPNYLRFFLRNGTEFPRLDEQLQWLFHAAFRLRQQECLDVHLHRTVSALLGAPRPEAELRAVRKRFADVWTHERQLAEGWNSRNASRRQHAAVCDWTWQFHTGLMREFAAMEAVNSGPAVGYKLSLMRQLPWYYPTTAAGGWACWAVVVELALRNMIEAWWSREPAKPRQPPSPFAIRAAECLAPTILFSPTPGGTTPVALTIHFGALERTGVASRIVGFPVRRVWWELSQNDVPWPTKPDSAARPDHNRQKLTMRPPSAADIWKWAAGAQDTSMFQFLGMTSTE